MNQLILPLDIEVKLQIEIASCNLVFLRELKLLMSQPLSIFP
ncbi:hypothetical protein [Viridibacillus arvi]